jgi:hypothetical protein
MINCWLRSCSWLPASTVSIVLATFPMLSPYTPTHSPDNPFARLNRRGLPRDLRLSPWNWRGPPPRFHESTWGVWQKLSHLNALKSLDGDRLFAEYNSRDRLARLCSLSDQPAWPQWSTNASQGSPMLAPWESRPRAILRFCPECLRHGFHSSVFQMPHLSRCPAHAEPLLERCPACAQTVPYRLWNPGYAFQCACGHLLWEGRDRVGAWYGKPKRLEQIDDFVRELLKICKPGRRSWFRIDALGAGVDEGADLPQRLLWVSPMDLRRLPRSFHACLNESDLQEGRVSAKFYIGEAFESHPAALTEWCAEQLAEVERNALALLGNHRRCIGEARVCVREEGTLLRLDRCATATALMLWRAHWRSHALQLTLGALGQWTAQTITDALRQRGLVPAQCLNRPPQSARIGFAGPLPNLIVRQVLVGSLTQFRRVARRIALRSLSATDPRQVLRATRGDRKLWDPALPPIWIELTCGSARLQLWHQGTESIQAWNQLPCRVSAAGLPCTLEGLESASNAEVNGARPILDAPWHGGLTCPELELGVFDRP